MTTLAITKPNIAMATLTSDQIQQKSFQLNHQDFRNSSVRTDCPDDRRSIADREKEKTTVFNRLSLDKSEPIKLFFDSIRSISVECIEMVKKATTGNEKALLITVHSQDEDQSSYLIELDGLALESKSGKPKDEDHFERLYHTLSLREQSVLRQVSLGNTSGEIAAKMYIAINTVKNHRKNIKRKLNFIDNLDYSRFLKWSLDYFEVRLAI